MGCACNLITRCPLIKKKRIVIRGPYARVSNENVKALNLSHTCIHVHYTSPLAPEDIYRGYL